MLAIEFGHNLPVTGDEIFHALTFAQELVPVGGIELEGVAFAGVPFVGFAAAEVPGVVVESHSPDAMELAGTFALKFFEETAGPVPVVNIRAGGYQRKRLVRVVR